MRELLMILALLALLCGLVVYMVNLMPEAMHTETIKHAVSVGQWHHHKGYGEYASFIKENP